MSDRLSPLASTELREISEIIFDTDAKSKQRELSKKGYLNLVIEGAAAVLLGVEVLLLNLPLIIGAPTSIALLGVVLIAERRSKQSFKAYDDLRESRINELQKIISSSTN